jgi:hypothetical protein
MLSHGRYEVECFILEAIQNASAPLSMTGQLRMVVIAREALRPKQSPSHHGIASDFTLLFINDKVLAITAV